MKSIACVSSCVRAACQHTAPCLPVTRTLLPPGTCSSAEFARKSGTRYPRVTAARSFSGTHANAAAVQQVSAAPAPTAGRVPDQVALYRYGRPAQRLNTAANPAPQLYSPVTVRSLFEADVVPELCSRLAHLPDNDRAEGLTTLLGACVEFGLGADSSLVVRLVNESVELLSNGRVGVAQLCHLGAVAHGAQGRQSALLVKVLDRVSAAAEEDALSADEAAKVYSLLALRPNPGGPRQRVLLSALNRHTQRVVHQLSPGHVSTILQSILKLQQSQAISLVLKLSHRASQVFKALSDDEAIKVLSALMRLRQLDEKLVAAMENHLPERLGKCDPELISTVMEYCLQMRCRSEVIFEAVAENFVCHAEDHTTLQIAKQIVAMGRLNYLPRCSSQMFKKLESILSSRFSQFDPRTLIELLHACIHLERFPFNYMPKVFCTYFLQRLHAQGKPLDKNILGQLTQLHLSTELESTYYWGPRLPYFFHVKKFSTMDHAFETPMENFLYKQVKGPLTRLLGGTFYSTKISTHKGYTIDVEICLDERGYVLPLSQWEHTHKRVALCVDGQNRFSNNTHHLLGKEATKRRHLRGMGYELVEIPYFEFEKLTTKAEQVQYLHNKIFPSNLKTSHAP